MGTDLDYAGCRRLVAAVLLRAAQDVLRGRSCNGQCDDVHVCAGAALAWLGTPAAATLADVLEVRFDLARLAINQVRQPSKFDELAEAMLDDPQAKPGELAKRLDLKVSTIYGYRWRLKSLAAALGAG